MTAVVTLKEFADFPALIEALTADVIGTLAQALHDSPRAALAVSGGSTPEPLFRALAGGDGHDAGTAAASLDWDAVDLTLADERWVPPEDPASNEGLLRRTLFAGKPAAARFAGLYTGHPTPEEGERGAAGRLDALTRPFDLIQLGMGDDGHTASLFPHAPALAAALTPKDGSPVRAIRADGIPQPRMTLTLPRILNARRIVLMIRGAGKKRVLDQAMAEGPVEDMPIRAVLRQTAVPVTILWAP